MTYDYLGKYLFTANMRRDGSSRFAKETNGVISRQCQWDGVSQMKIHEVLEEIPGRW